MEIEGRIIAVLPAREGVSSRGSNWKSQDYVIETHDQYPRKCCFSLMNERIGQFNIQPGEELRVSFDIDAHEYQGRWFNSIRAWKVERYDPNAVAQAPIQGAPYVAQAPIPPTPPTATAAPQVQEEAKSAPFPPAQEGNSEDDLPF